MLTGILRVAFIILEVLVLFNLLIIVHEVGHFLAARWRGLVVERFGIWFGKPIWKKKIGGVEYSLGCIPAGGFVALPQMAPMEAIEGKNLSETGTLPPISALDKIIVAAAGPLFSFLLAIFCAVLVWIVGRPVAESEVTTTIGYLQAGGPAEAAGFKPGDEILEVDGRKVNRFAGMVDSVIWNVVRSEGDTISFRVRRESEVLDLEATPVREPRRGWGRSNLRQVQIAPKLTPMVAAVQPGTPAAESGFLAGDILLSANGSPLHHPSILSDMIRATPGQRFAIEIQRGEDRRTLEVTPTLLPGEHVGDPSRPRIGIVWDLSGRMGIIPPRPFEQVAGSVQTIVNTLGALFSPKSDIKAQHLSGPVGIMRIYYMMFENPDGWRMALWFSVVLNVNLALLNLLPLPVLDGGHITIALIEAIRRKPVNTRVLEFVQTACAMLLIGYMLYVTFFDVQDLSIFRNRDAEDVPAAQSSPAPSPQP